MIAGTGASKPSSPRRSSTSPAPLFVADDISVDLENTVHALDSSAIDLCLSVFPWALFRSIKSVVKLHTLLDLQGSIPALVHVSNARGHDVNMLDTLTSEPGAFFVIRAKSNTQFRRRSTRPTSPRVYWGNTVVGEMIRFSLHSVGGAEKEGRSHEHNKKDLKKSA